MARSSGLYRRQDSPYWWLDVRLPNGRHVRQSTGLADLAAAEEFLTRLRHEAYEAVRTGQPVAHNWQEAVVRYLDGQPRNRTLEEHKLLLAKLDPYLRDQPLAAIDMTMLDPFIATRRHQDRVAKATINRALEVVRRILRLAHEDWGWLAQSPRIRLLPEPGRRIRHLTREEADRLIAACPKHMKPLVQYALATGCRMGEILGLEWRRVDLARRVAWLEPGTTKNGEGRGIPLNADAVLALRQVEKQHERWCFTYGEKRMRRIGSAWKFLYAAPGRGPRRPRKRLIRLARPERLELPTPRFEA